MKILVIDDDILMLRVMSRILVNDGHEVITSSDAERAMGLFRQAQPDLVVTDIIIPGQEGWRRS